MRMTEVEFGSGTPIDSYGPGFFRVAGTVRKGPLLILPDTVLDWAGYGHWDAVTAARDAFDVLFIGAGAEIAPLPAAEASILNAADIPYELMATPAACRTYNVLLSEGRRVAAALLPT